MNNCNRWHLDKWWTFPMNLIFTGFNGRHRDLGQLWKIEGLGKIIRDTLGPQGCASVWMCFFSCYSNTNFYQLSFHEYVKYCICTMASRYFCLVLMTLIFSFVHSFIHSLGKRAPPKHKALIFKIFRVCFQRVYNLEGEIKHPSDIHEYLIYNEKYIGKE